MSYKVEIRTGVIFFFLILLGIFQNLEAQTFDDARDAAFNGEREKARSICRKILSEGFNSDVALLMGRTYAWDGMYDSARIVLSNVLVEKPGNIEAWDALSDVEFWSGNYEKAIGYCNDAIKSDSTQYSFVLKKARILYSEKEYDEAVTVLEDFLKQHPNQPDFLIKLKEYRPYALKNNIKLNYTLDFFNKDFNRDPWHLVALSYGRKTKLGTVIARVNYIRRFGESGVQYEADAYPKLGENSYGYLNYGYSKNQLYPRNRFGAEWYQNFPHAYEGSAGIRLLGFRTSVVDIYTATIGKYLGNYWLSFRTYITPDQTGTSFSGYLSVRRYFADSENYLGLKAGYGISPDDRWNPLETKQVLLINTGSVRAEFNHLFNKIWILNLIATLGAEEINPEEYSGYVTFDISISRLF